jgi:elongation factor Ts
MTISANLVKELREKTNAGMMDCKKALTETNGDFEAAVDWLRKKGLSSAAKKSSRAAAKGLVALQVEQDTAVMIELNSETDFVAMNDKFQALVKNIVTLALKTDGSVDSILAQAYPNTGRSVKDEIIEHVAVIGENMNLRRSVKLSVNNGVIASYVHNTVVDNLGTIGVLVVLESNATDKAKLNTLGRQIAMHIAASKPEAIRVEEIDPALIERERALHADRFRTAGKPENMIDKMVEGALRKFYEESALLEQPFVMDGKTKVAEVVAQVAKELNANIEIKAFKQFTLGEGVEQEVSNFADEVAAIVQGNN